MRLYSTFLITTLLGTSLYSSDIELSQTKTDILDYSYKKAQEDSKKLKKDWINPIFLKYSYNHGENYDTKKTMISISQPIFKSGGIYYAIKYASKVEQYSTTTIQKEKRELIRQLVDILFQIKSCDIDIKKQELVIQNAKLDIKTKKEQVLAGTLDISFLDNAILDLNMKQNTLIDLQLEKKSLKNTLSTLSNKKYEELELPKLKMISKKQFLEKNLNIKQAKEDSEQYYWLKQMTKANYLPTVNVTADYTKYYDNPDIDPNPTKNIGFNISIPLDIKSNNQIESAKIAYLQKKLTLLDQEDSELAILKNTQAKLDSLDEKINIAKENLNLYKSLLSQIEEQYEAGIKTKADVQIMENSKSMKTLEIQSLYIDKQRELLNIYARVSFEI